MLEKTPDGILPLVSVIIPAFNAEETLAGTLDSVVEQSYPALEIIVVDDGSADGTAEVALSYARTDPRIQLIQQENGGVASARNAGLKRASGEFIAPLDADDIWHRDKILLQVDKFTEMGEGVAVVYTWFRRIDGQDRIIAPSASPSIEGWVLHRHLQLNFVGNGSGPLIRAYVLRDIRYNEEMRSEGNGGCEDYLLQLRLANRHRFAVVPAFLIGYRKRSGQMSSDVARMTRSYLHMYRILEIELAPRAKSVVRRRISELQIELARNRIRRLKIREAARAFREALVTAPVVAARHTIRQIDLGLTRTSRRLGLHKSGRSPLVGRKFAEVDPGTTDSAWRPKRKERWLHTLERFDQEMGYSPAVEKDA